jgi:N6-L-threonylcarbamoyladenine synthase/protein kinase Bud32
MIAVLGARMFAAGDTLAVEDSAVLPDYRPDEVAVTWRGEESVSVGDPRRFRDGPDAGGTAEVRGAEATVALDPGAGRVRKRRVPKAYRHPALDDRLRRERTVLEARLTSAARRRGVPTPVVFEVDPREGLLVVEYVGDRDLRAAVGDPDGADDAEGRVRTVGTHLARLHGAGIVHGDPTTRNVRLAPGRTYLIDFGLGYHSDHVEDFAMDLHVFEGSLGGTAADPEGLAAAFEAGYRDAGDGAVLARLEAVRERGRYRDRGPD